MFRRTRALSIRATAAVASLSLASWLVGPALVAEPLCDPWDDTFQAFNFDDNPFDSIVWDDGSGPNLYVVGKFKTAGGVPALHVAR